MSNTNPRNDIEYRNFYLLIEDALLSGFDKVIVSLDENSNVIVDVEDGKSPHVDKCNKNL